MKLATKCRIFKLISKLPRRISNIYYRKIGMCKQNSDVRKGIQTDNPSRILIGENCLINVNSQFHFGCEPTATITIENRVYVAPNVSFYCVSHKIGNTYQRAGANTYNSILVREGSWVCANAVILPGVTVGKGAIIAAGSVVTSNIPDNEMWGGVPARFIKKLD